MPDLLLYLICGVIGLGIPFTVDRHLGKSYEWYSGMSKNPNILFLAVFCIIIHTFLFIVVFVMSLIFGEEWLF